ncbi:MAG: hypothetical protein RIR01_132, partial [Bacteroidota bacterium]
KKDDKTRMLTVHANGDIVKEK